MRGHLTLLPKRHPWQSSTSLWLLRRCVTSSCLAPASLCEGCGVVPAPRVTPEPRGHVPCNVTTLPEGPAVGEAVAPGAADGVFAAHPAAWELSPPGGLGHRRALTPAPAPRALPCPRPLRALITPADRRPLPQKTAPDWPRTKKKNSIKAFRKELHKKLGFFGSKSHHFLCRHKFLLLQLKNY